jgi:hypothetical protein
MSLFVFTHYMKNVHGVGAAKKNLDFNTMAWAGLGTTCLVVMASGSRLYKNINCNNIESDRCDRTEFAFSLGVITGVISLVWLVFGSRISDKVDACLGILMLAAWCFGIGYITFGGDKAPARGLGNLYFSTWIAFMISCFLAANGMKVLFGERFGTTETQPTDKPADEPAKEAEAEAGGDVVPIDEETGAEAKA